MKTDVKYERVVHKALERQVERYGNKTFLYFKDRRFGYADMNAYADRVASGLQSLGIRKGDKVAILLSNCPEYLFLWFGISKLGAMEVPINTAHRGDILAYMLDNSDACTLIIDYRFIDRVQPILPGLTKLKNIVLSDFENLRDDTDAGTGDPRVTSWSDMVDNDGTFRPCDVLWSDPYSIMYTSGTTGPSKGILLPQNYALYLADCINQAAEYTENDRLYDALPLYHGNAQILSFLPGLTSGASVVLAEKFSASGFWADITHYGCTEFNYIGGIIPILFKADPKSDDADNPIRIMVGAAAPKDIFYQFEERFGLELVEIYGMNEIALPLMANRKNRKPGSCGKARSDFHVKLVDDDDIEVGPNMVGEILARPLKPYSMMLEYYKMPEKTVEAWGDLWFRTGDYAYCDYDGFYFFVDRKKDALRRRGENISSYEVEKVINSHPAVLESAAIAVKSDLGEDEVMVCIRPKDDRQLDFVELMEYCNQRMAYFMVPRYVRIVKQLPKTGTEKVQKVKLRDDGVTPDTWDREVEGVKLDR
jgi:crotonobetaine/carnitine-CoA ligase